MTDGDGRNMSAHACSLWPLGVVVEIKKCKPCGMQPDIFPPLCAVVWRYDSRQGVGLRCESLVGSAFHVCITHGLYETRAHQSNIIHDLKFALIMKS